MLLSPSCKPASREKYSCATLEKWSDILRYVKGQVNTSFLYWASLQIRPYINWYLAMIHYSQQFEFKEIGLVEWFSWHQIFMVESLDFSVLPYPVPSYRVLRLCMVFDPFYRCLVVRGLSVTLLIRLWILQLKLWEKFLFCLQLPKWDLQIWSEIQCYYHIFSMLQAVPVPVISSAHMGQCEGGKEGSYLGGSLGRGSFVGRRVLDWC